MKFYLVHPPATGSPLITPKQEVRWKLKRMREKTPETQLLFMLQNQAQPFAIVCDLHLLKNDYFWQFPPFFCKERQHFYNQNRMFAFEIRDNCNTEATTIALNLFHSSPDRTQYTNMLATRLTQHRVWACVVVRSTLNEKSRTWIIITKPIQVIQRPMPEMTCHQKVTLEET